MSSSGLDRDLHDPATGMLADADRVHTPGPSLPAPKSEIGVYGWLRANLFSSWFNSILTVVAAYAIYLILPPLLDWAIFSADFVGDSRDSCTSGGACWVFVSIRFDQFIYGFYPVAERWRPTLAIGLGLVCLVYVLTDGLPYRGKVAAFLCVPYPIIAFFLLSGGLGLETVETSKWGGLLLTIVIAGVGISASLPIGIALALGRRSNMPVVRMLCIGFIEFVRAVPLITILFMSLVILPLFLPPGSNFDQLLRALIGVSLFAAAYMAETVRGGLQAIPKGQYEAAMALGLGYWQMMRLIILPQALRIVIPAIVSSFIGLFKDTTLVLIIGLVDLLAMVQLAITDSKWIGLSTEGYAFCAIVFFIFCFGMSRYSMYLERKLDTGYRR
jgi:general L-amino acid transport system permease protein